MQHHVHSERCLDGVAAIDRFNGLGAARRAVRRGFDEVQEITSKTAGIEPVTLVDETLEMGTPLEVELGGVKVTVQRDKDGGVRAVRSDTGESLMVRLAYWFAWSAYFPETGIHPEP